MLKFKFFYILIFLSISSFSQSVDSLYSLAYKSNVDSVRMRLLIEISDVCDIPEIKKYADSALVYANRVLKEHPTNENATLYKSVAYNNIGFMFQSYGDLDNSLLYYEKSLKAIRIINDSTELARTLNNISIVQKSMGEVNKALNSLLLASEYATGSNETELLSGIFINLSNIYFDMGDIRKALDVCYKGLKFQEERGNEYGISFTYNTIAVIYHSQGEYKKAEEFYLKSMDIVKKMGLAQALSDSYNNLGHIYEVLGKDSLALEYYNNSLDLRIELENEVAIAESYSNIGSYYMDNLKTEEAIEYFLKSIKIRERIGEKEGISSTYFKMANALLFQGNVKLALEYGEKSMKVAQVAGFPEDVKYASLVLSDIYEKLGEHKKALEMQKLFIKTKDSLFNSSTQKAMIQNELNYSFEKQQFADSIEVAKEKEILNIKMASQNSELERLNTRNMSLIIGVLMLLILVTIALFAYQNKRKSANTISKQKEEVEQQKTLVEEKNKEITDSIEYAKRIQNALLPSESIIKENLKNSFVYYLPKDIVAGDFYWLSKEKNKILFAAADCTGHGVPGAMVSVICNGALNRSVKEFNLIEPADILNKAREIIIEEFNKSDENVRDGMDIALCSLEGYNLQFSGANNPLWVVRDGEIMEIKGDKQPVGKQSRSKPFTNHNVELKKGDHLYLFSDGYYDQFGGVKGKKFKSKKFKQLLISTEGMEMGVVPQFLDKHFNEWRGENEQIDDVCVIGVKV